MLKIPLLYALLGSLFVAAALVLFAIVYMPMCHSDIDTVSSQAVYHHAVPVLGGIKINAI